MKNEPHPRPLSPKSLSGSSRISGKDNNNTYYE